MNDFFYYIKSDRRAIFVLSVVGLVLLFLNLFVLNAGNEDSEMKGMDDSIIMSFTQEKEKTEPVLKMFDPNTIDSATLADFGIKPAQIRVLMNFRQAGHVFNKPEDISKLYTWNGKDIERLLPYIEIDEKILNRRQKKYPVKYAKKDDDLSASEKYVATHGQDSIKAGKNLQKFTSLVKIDPNEADSALLRKIPGIGQGISRSIIEYRKRLGGFVSESQLLEIKIFSPELLEWFEIKNANLKQIQINSASFQTLNAHPYVSYEQTREILRYIRLYGKINNKEILRSTNIFTQEELDKVLPYLKFSE